MIGLGRIDWGIAALVVGGVVVCATLLWLLLRTRLSEDEIEQQRRLLLVQSGRLVDGMLLDLLEMDAEDGRTLTLLVFNYRIGGVEYTCSQDITGLKGIVDPAEVRVGFPCSVRYQPGNSQNSIIVAEGWSGLRAGLPQFKDYEDPEPVDTSHLKSKMGLGTRD